MTMSMKITACLFLVALFACSAVGQTQQPPTITVWGTGGIGLSTVYHSNVHNSLQYSIGLRRESLTAKYQRIHNVESVLHSVIHLSELAKYPLETVNSQSLQIGYTMNLFRAVVPDHLTACQEKNISFFIGLLQYQSVARGRYLGEPLGSRQYEEIKDSGIGVPIEIEYEWRYNNHFGATTSLHAEINGTQSYIGLLVNIMLGTF